MKAIWNKKICIEINDLWAINFFTVQRIFFRNYAATYVDEIHFKSDGDVLSTSATRESVRLTLLLPHSNSNNMRFAASFTGYSGSNNHFLSHTVKVVFQRFYNAHSIINKKIMQFP